MRIFISDVRSLLAEGADKSALARALLRHGVKEVWGCEMPHIEKDRRGKPLFAGMEKMHFSLSHSKTHVLVALSDAPVGADTETLRPVKEENERLFSPGMLADFGYFGGWCLREAVFKLRGEGSLRSMDIRMRDGEAVTPYEGIKCALYSLPGCVAAAASRGDEFPYEIEIVESTIFWNSDA